MFRWKSLFFGGLVFVLCCNVARVSFATAVIVESPAGNATGILGLDVPGYGTFDVTFGHTFTDVWGDVASPSPVPTFWGDSLGARSAGDAIVSVFHAHGGIADASDTWDVLTNWVFVPYGQYMGTEDVLFRNLQSGLSSPIWSGPHGGFGAVWCDSYADFTPSGGTPIPEPSTLILFGFGFLGFLGYFVRQRKRLLKGNEAKN